MINRRHAMAAGAAASVLPSIASGEPMTGFDAALGAAFDAVKPVALTGGLKKALEALDGRIPGLLAYAVPPAVTAGSKLRIAPAAALRAFLSGSSAVLL